MTEMSVVASTFPPERTTRDRPVPSTLPAQQRRHTRGTRALDDELRPLEAEHDRLRDLRARHLHHRVETVAEDRAAQLAQLLDGDAVGDRRIPRARRPHADDAHPGSHDFAPSAMPAARPPPPTGTTTVSTPSSCSASSSPIGPLPGDDVPSSNAWT